MQSSIFRKAVRSLLSRLGIPAPIETSFLLDFKARVRQGIRENDDYDDGWICALLLKSKKFADVGCNAGFFCLLSCLLDPVRKSIAIDANHKAIELTRENLALNGFEDRVSFVCCFASDKDAQEKEFFTVGHGAAGSMFKSHAKTAASKKNSHKVVTITLDSIFFNAGFVPDFVKMDIEGAEQLALAGAKKTAAEKMTRFLVEMHSNSDMSMADNARGVLNWCRETGYHAYYLAEHVPLTAPEQVSARGRCHLLLQPAEWEYPPYLKKIKQSDSIEKTYKMMKENQ